MKMLTTLEPKSATIGAGVLRCSGSRLLGCVLAGLLALSGSTVTHAGVISAGGRLAGRILLQVESKELAALALRSEDAVARLVKELGEAGAERFVRQLSPEAKALLSAHGERGASLLLQCGDSAAPLLARYGDDVLRVFDSVGPHTPRWVATHGEAGVRVAGRYGVATTERLAATAGPRSYEVVLKAGRPASAILQRNPAALPLFQAALTEGSERTLIDTIERGGDRFFRFAERHWKGISIAPLGIAFASQPEAFVKPVAEAGEHVLTRTIERAIEAISHPQSLGGAISTFIIFATLLWFLFQSGSAFARFISRRLSRRHQGEA